MFRRNDLLKDYSMSWYKFLNFYTNIWERSLKEDPLFGFFMSLIYVNRINQRITIQITLNNLGIPSLHKQSLLPWFRHLVSETNYLLFFHKMVIINVLSSANVTTGGATCTGHLVTAVLLDECLLTPVTVPYHGLGQSGLNIGSHACLPLFLHFITTQWDMIGLLTQSAKQVKECHMSENKFIYCFSLHNFVQNDTKSNFIQNKAIYISNTVNCWEQSL